MRPIAARHLGAFGTLLDAPIAAPQAAGRWTLDCLGPFPFLTSTLTGLSELTWASLLQREKATRQRRKNSWGLHNNNLKKMTTMYI